MHSDPATYANRRFASSSRPQPNLTLLKRTKARRRSSRLPREQVLVFEMCVCVCMCEWVGFMCLFRLSSSLTPDPRGRSRGVNFYPFPCLLPTHTHTTRTHTHAARTQANGTSFSGWRRSFQHGAFHTNIDLPHTAVSRESRGMRIGSCGPSRCNRLQLIYVCAYVLRA